MTLKKTALTYGLLSAAVSIAMMFIAVPFITPESQGTADVLGYTSILLSALFVFFGIRSYRENAAEGRMTFSKGLAVGLLITLISTVCYAAAFEVMYFKKEVIMRIWVTSVMVDDQDRALKFYTDVLGFIDSDRSALRRLLLRVGFDCNR